MKFVIKKKSSEILDSNPTIKTIKKVFILPNGFVDTFHIERNKDSVCIFAITDTQEVLFVEQFRANYEEVVLELPGGGLEKDEGIVHGAQRELLEETGYMGDLQHLASVTYSPYSTGKRHMFLATNCKKIQEPNLDPNEFLKIKLFSLDQVKNQMMPKAEFRGFDTAYLSLDLLKLL